MPLIHLFSRRHESTVEDNTLVLILSEELRRRIWDILEQFNFAFEVPGSDLGGWIEVTDVFASTVERLEEIYSTHPLAPTDNGNRSFEELDVLVKGGHPTLVFDLIEVFYKCISETHKLDFQKTINEAFEEENSDWRLTDGQFLRVTSPVAPARTTSQSMEFAECYEAALERFQGAQQDLESGNYQSAVSNACESFESVLKFILARESHQADSTKNGAQNNILSRIGRAFGGQVLNSLSFLGAGRDLQVEFPNVTREYAELAVNLTASFMFFASSLFWKEPSTPPGVLPKEYRRPRAV